ncbi:hypothetical protein GCM10022198_00150 [Klugiella xanthotipulae]|uniref:Tail protein n=1 Tax=Klugiella xanthotipulae TaxID=244735 RepID=A0A543I5K6_9MICO|nr:hypothetical protein [Klugiella xanthotipulae]TQM65844.1 hypothetical protein FB466_0658 [Klugiella xanthotipulae]
MIPLIEFEGLTIPGTPTGGADGASGWFFRELTGWRDLTDDKSPINERARQHGAHGAAASFRKAAAISFDVAYIATTEADLLTAHDALAGIGADGPVPLRVTDPTGTTERMVTVSGITVADWHGRTYGTATVDVLARDPRRYSIGDAWSTTRPATAGTGLVWPAISPLKWPSTGGSTGRITLANRGTKSSSPLYRVYGGYSGFAITELASQRQISVELSVPAGSYVEIDTGRRRALLDGQSDVSRYITSREWWDIPAATSSTVQITLTGASVDPYLAGMVRSAW